MRFSLFWNKFRLIIILCLVYIFTDILIDIFTGFWIRLLIIVLCLLRLWWIDKILLKWLNVLVIAFLYHLLLVLVDWEIVHFVVWVIYMTIILHMKRFVPFRGNSLILKVFNPVLLWLILDIVVKISIGICLIICLIIK